VEKIGSSGCAQYISEKVENPAQNKAQLARRYALVPAIKPDDMMKTPWTSAIEALPDLSMSRLRPTKKRALAKRAFVKYEGSAIEA
jgi:hypothetical protein